MLEPPAFCEENDKCSDACKATHTHTHTRIQSHVHRHTCTQSFYSHFPDTFRSAGGPQSNRLKTVQYTIHDAASTASN